MNYIESIADRLKASALSLNSGWELKPENYADIMEAVKKINVNQTEMKRCLISAAINITKMTLANNNVLSADEKNQVFLISSRIAAYAVCAKCGFEDKSILGSYRNDIEYGRYSQAVMNAVSETAAKTVHLTLGSVEKNVKISDERINEYERSLFPADRTGNSFGNEYDRGRSDGVPQNVGSYAERQSDRGRSAGTSPLETEYGYTAERTGQIRRNEEIGSYGEESYTLPFDDTQRSDYGVSGERAGEVRETYRKSDDNVSGVGQQIRDSRPADEVGTLGEISSSGFNIGAESGTNSITELESELNSLSSEIENKRKEAVKLISEDKVTEAGEVLSEITSLKENSERISAELEKAKQAIPEGFINITADTAKEMVRYGFSVTNNGIDHFAKKDDVSEYIEMTLVADNIHDINVRHSKSGIENDTLYIENNVGLYYWDDYSTVMSVYENVMKALHEGNLSPVENYIALAEAVIYGDGVNVIDGKDLIAFDRAKEHFTKFKEMTGAFEQSDISESLDIDSSYELLHHLVSEDERVINAALNSDRQNLTNEIKAVMAKKALSILTENPKNNSAFYNDFSSENKSGRYDDTFNAVLETVLERAEQQRAADLQEDVTEDVTETIRNAVAEILSHDDNLKTSAKNNSYNDFSFAYYSRVEEILVNMIADSSLSENMQTEIAALLDNNKYLHDVFSEYDSFLTGYAFENNDLMRVIAKNGLAWDEIESIGYDLYEQGYIDRYKPSETASYGNGMSEVQLYDFARRMNNGEDIRAELAKALIGGQKNNKIEFVTFGGEFHTDTYSTSRYRDIPIQSMQVHFGEDTVTAVCGDIRREISYAEMGQAFLDLAKGEYDDIVQDRTVEDLRDKIDSLSVEEAVGLISAFDGAATHGWNEEGLTNNAKINRIKKSLYDILGDEEKTETAFISIADMKYNYKAKSAPTAERAKEEAPAAMNTAMPEVTKSSARTSYPTPHKKSKNGDTIIGNTVFKYIPHKTRTDVSNDIVDEIEKELVNRSIKFSGVIKTDGATITVSKENQPVLQEIISLLSGKETVKEDESVSMPADNIEETVTDTTEKSADEEKPMTTDDISVGDRFLYRGREYTVTSLTGIYPDDIGVSYIEGTGSAAFEVTQNIDKFRLAREGKYLGREEEKTETYDVRMSRTLNVSNGVSVYVSGSEVDNLHSYIYGTYPSYDEAASAMIDIRRAMENDTALRDEYFSKCPYYERDIMINTEVEIDGTAYVVTDINRRSDSITLSDENENFINRRFSDIDRIVNEQSYEQTESIENKGVGKTVDELEVGDVIRFNGKEVTITEINGDFTIWFDNDGGAIIGNWKKELERMGYEYIPQDKSVNLENSPSGNDIKDKLSDIEESKEEHEEDTPTVDSSFRYTILLVKSGDEYRDYRFSDFEDLQRYGKTPNRDSLTEAYSGNVADISNALNDFAALDRIYEVFNTRHPDDYNNRSLSVGDIVLLERDNEAHAYMVSGAGFRDVSEYILNKPLENTSPEKDSELLTALKEHRDVYFKDEPEKIITEARAYTFTNRRMTYNEETNSFELRGNADRSGEHLTDVMINNLGGSPLNAEFYINTNNLAVDRIDGENSPVIENTPENSPSGNFSNDRETETSEIKFGDEFIAPETEQLDLFSVNPAEKAMENLSAWGGDTPKEEKPTTEELFAQAGISADNPPTVTPEVEAEILEQRMNDISGNGTLSDTQPVMEREYTEEKIPDREENPLAVSPELEAEVREFLGNLENPFTPEQEEKIAKGLEELFSDTPETEIPRSVDTTAEKGKNFVITDDNFGVTGGEKSRFIANVEAIRTLKTIEAENRTATPEEQQILSKFTGWGAISQAFDDSNSKWSKEYEELKELLTPEEYAAAARSTMNAHYTTPLVISAIYEGLKNLGFESGKILEPAMGIGNFFGMLPENMRDSELYGVELDSITGRIAKQLYPEANIQVKGFEKTEYKDSSFDVAVGNVPFGSYQLNDRRYNDNKFMIHDYFFAKALDKVHSGGVIAFVTSQGTMDKESEKVREYIAQRAELLGAIRLPGGRNGAFKENAGTEVTTDIIFLQKRDRPIEINPDEVGWIHKAENADGFSINNYFVEHPEMVLGKIIAGNKMYANQENDTSCEAFPDKDLKELLANAVKSLNGAYRSAEIEVSPEDKVMLYNKT